MAPESSTNVDWSCTTRARGSDGGKPPPRAPFSPKPTNPWRKSILVIFCVLALVALAVNAAFVLELSKETAKKPAANDTRVAAGKPAVASAGNPAALKAAQLLRNRLLIVFGLSVVCFGSFIFLFVVRFLRPLRSVNRGARRMAEGDLSVTLPATSADEVGSLASTLMDIAANYQEILLLTGTQVGHCRTRIKQMQRMLEEGQSGDPAELQDQIGAIAKELNMLSDMVKRFDFYQTRFDGDRVVRNRSDRTRG